LLSHGLAGQGSVLKIFFLDDVGNWNAGGTKPLDIPQIALGNFFWTLGDTFAVSTYVTSITSSFYDYDIQILHWDEQYQFSNTVFHKENLHATFGLPFVATLVHNHFVASGPHLFRFNGQTWQQKTVKLQIPVVPGNAFWFAEGGNISLITQNSFGEVFSLLAVYDPNTDTMSWGNNGIVLEHTEPSDARLFSYFPTTSTDFISLGKKIYYRGSSTNWASSTAMPIYTIPEDEIVNTTTLSNQSPVFFSYLQYQDKYGLAQPFCTKVLNLKNGQVSIINTLDGRIVQTYNKFGAARSDLNGQFPVGPSMVRLCSVGVRILLFNPVLCFNM
jgi:hypothetical protein